MMKYRVACTVHLALGLILASSPGWLPKTFGQGTAAPATSFSGTVIETTNAASYTYVRIDTGKEKVWAAAPQFAVKVGDKASFSDGMPMAKFQSKALNRTFDMVYFVGKIETPGAVQANRAGAAPPAVAGHGQGAPNDDVHAGLHRPAAANANPPARIDFTGIKKAAGGLTVAEVYQQKAKLEKKQVVFRGKVVKFKEQVMNRNWAHVQDGTGASGANDITVTTADTAKVGDTVLVRGTLVLNQDFGYGYKYPLVVQDARISVESAAAGAAGAGVSPHH